MEISRRNLIRNAVAAGGLAAAATALPGVLRSAASADAAPSTTLGATFATGPAGAGGYRSVIRASGEPHRARTGLGILGDAGRAARRQGLISFVQLSDIHIVDAQSPLRLEWTDRLDDPSPLPATGLFTSSYRPQEMLTGQVADSMVRAINRIGSGPVTGQPFALAIQTGDNSDNSQLNEVRWNITTLNGGPVRFDSGNLGSWEGVADSSVATYDPAYWHPHGNPAGKPVDHPRSEYGFPVVPGLLDAARRPFTAEGLQIPWYSVFGNHDGLAQGNFPASTLQLNLIALGALKVVSPPLGLDPGQLLEDLTTDPAAVLTGLLSGVSNAGVRVVTPDLNRRLLTRKQIVEQHFLLGGAPFGHGFTSTNRQQGTAYYSFDRGRVRFVVLDTVNPNGYSDGSLDPTQFAWLTALLAQSADRIVLVFSHHTSDTMGNPLIATGGSLEPRVTGAKVLDALLATPSVVAWINGHTHRNKVTPRPRPGGGGLWEITTASHIDWPQQARIVEVADNQDGTLSLFTTMVDHTGPASAGAGTESAERLAGLARELAANDWHDHGAGLGTPEDRNVELLVANPLA
ncbi:TIGR03767 family metallophosphoesterase [Nocardioides albidus]|uniref:TIGR03767 family metallophosphoesterase n=1 Tax=Nocardioides albidus TaxID=1517589 RepID=A0A5C4VYZ9_9ACTN|nr:TIGR03767 family metallophosphoesterase [Nocardioides albidus]TNM41138.1 TIGR03767 family metallophosphoesterase [Nocardioides albidus]